MASAALGAPFKGEIACLAGCRVKNAPFSILQGFPPTGLHWRGGEQFAPIEAYAAPGAPFEGEGLYDADCFLQKAEPFPQMEVAAVPGAPTEGKSSYHSTRQG